MSEIKEYIDKKQLFDLVYPVGAIYLSAIAVDPAVLFGIGKWEKIEGKFLLSSSSSYTIGSTGGEATHKLTTSEMPSHNHGPGIDPPGTSTYNSYAFTVNRHYSSSSTQRFTVDKGTGYVVMGANKNADDFGGNSDIEQALTTSSTGGGTAHNNMPPYLVINAWKRVS